MRTPVEPGSEPEQIIREELEILERVLRIINDAEVGPKGVRVLRVSSGFTESARRSRLSGKYLCSYPMMKWVAFAPSKTIEDDRLIPRRDAILGYPRPTLLYDPVTPTLLF